MRPRSAAGSTAEHLQAVPIQARPAARVLGAQRMGAVCCCRPRPRSTRGPHRGAAAAAAAIPDVWPRPGDHLQGPASGEHPHTRLFKSLAALHATDAVAAVLKAAAVHSTWKVGHRGMHCPDHLPARLVWQKSSSVAVKVTSLPDPRTTMQPQRSRDLLSRAHPVRDQGRRRHSRRSVCRSARGQRR